MKPLLEHFIFCAVAMTKSQRAVQKISSFLIKSRTHGDYYKARMWNYNSNYNSSFIVSWPEGSAILTWSIDNRLSLIKKCDTVKNSYNGVMTAIYNIVFEAF